MTPESLDCVVCGVAHFPARLRCRRCGGTAFRSRPVPDGVIGGVTRAHRIPEGCRFTCLVEVRCPGDLTLLAGAVSPPLLGDRVALRQDSDGAIHIDPLT